MRGKQHEIETKENLIQFSVLIIIKGNEPKEFLIHTTFQNVLILHIFPMISSELLHEPKHKHFEYVTKHF